MTRRGILALALAGLVLLALGASRTFAGKGGKPGGGGSEPPADPAIAMLDYNGKGPSILVVMNEDGSNVTEILTADDAGGSIGPPDWSPGGTHLVFTIGPRDAAAIHSMGVDGTSLTELRARNGSGPTWVRWSPGTMPDGVERIAYTDQAVLEDGSLGPEHLFLMETDGSNPIDTGKGSSSLSWSSDATRIAVSRRTNGIRIHHFGVDANGELELTDSPRYDLGADVSRVAWSKTQSDVLAVMVYIAGLGFEIWQIDLRDAVAAGYNSDGTPLFSLTTHALLASTSGLACDWSTDDTRLVMHYNPYYDWTSDHYGKPKYAKTGCWILDLGSGAEPTLLYAGAGDPVWRR